MAEMEKRRGRLCNYLPRSLAFVVLAALLAFFPAQPPEFVNQTVVCRSWEMLHLLLVGLAVSYGIFGCRNAAQNLDDGSTAAPAPAFVADLLQVQPVPDDDDADRLLMWSHRYSRREPEVVVAQEADGGAARSLRLPLRSLRAPINSDRNGSHRRTISEKMAVGDEASPPSFTLPLPAANSEDSPTAAGKRITVYKPSPPSPPPPPPPPPPWRPPRRTRRIEIPAAKEAAAEGPYPSCWSPAVAEEFQIGKNRDDSDTSDSPAPAPAPAEVNEVDKKAEEFIARFREQIRLQRIESIRQAAGRRRR